MFWYNEGGIIIEKVLKRERLPLSSDIVFKRVFSKEENKELLKGILEAILKTKIESIEIKNPEIPRNLVDSKAGILDIKVEINKDTIIDVEMQVRNEKDIAERSTRYLIAMSNDELKKGEEYKEIKKTITINLLNFNYLKRNSFLNVAHMKFEKNTEETYINMGYSKEEELATDRLEMIIIELPKFKQKNEGVESELSQWLWLILGEEEKIKMAVKKNKKIEKAVEIIDEMSMDEKEWELYRSRQMAIMNYNAGMYYAKKEGIELGIEEGKKEEKIEIVKKMLKEKMSVELIAKITHLSKEEIDKIKKNM